MESNALLVCSGSGMTADCRISQDVRLQTVDDFLILTNGITPNAIKRDEIESTSLR